MNYSRYENENKTISFLEDNVNHLLVVTSGKSYIFFFSSGTISISNHVVENICQIYVK